jgi:hypothetical protein
LRALAADVISLVRGGSATESVVAPEELAKRVAAERAEGRSPEAIAAQLAVEGVPPRYGSTWTPQMIRDLVFQGRRASETMAVETARASGTSAELPSTQRSSEP